VSCVIYTNLPRLSRAYLCVSKAFLVKFSACKMSNTRFRREFELVADKYAAFSAQNVVENLVVEHFLGENLVLNKTGLMESAL